MSKFNCDDPVAGLGRLDNRYRVTVEFLVDTESIDDAQAEVKELIDHGIIAVQDSIDGKVYDYDITDAEPAEVE